MLSTTQQQPATIGVIVAMDKEFAQLRQVLSDAREETSGPHSFLVGRVGEKTVVAMQCGIGKVNSAIGAQALITKYSPALVVSTGVAGGVDTRLDVRDVVVSRACCYHDAYCGSECAKGQILGMPAQFESPAALVDKALALDCGVTIRAGLTVSGEWFVDSREKMQAIVADFPTAMAVDMESASIAQTCHVYGVDFLSFRIISDVPLKDHKAQMYFDFWERLAEGSFEVTRAFLEAV